MLNKNWKFTDTVIEFKGRILRQVEYSDGVIGGFIEKESNLQGDAKVLDNAKVYDKARISGKTRISGEVFVSDRASVKEVHDVSNKNNK